MVSASAESLGFDAGSQRFLALVAGWWLALGHLSSALACFVTIIGIPYGIQHIKLALIALAPVGMTVVKSRN